MPPAIGSVRRAVANLSGRLPGRLPLRAVATAVAAFAALATVAALVAGQAGAARPVPAAGKGPAVVAYPSSATIPATGPLPAGSGAALALNAAIGEQEAGQIVVAGARSISATLAAGTLGGIQARLAWAHFVSFDGKPIPDALTPWDGAERPVEKANQPLYVILEIPYGTAPGSYAATVTVTADGVATPVKVSLHVFPVSLPAPNVAAGNLLTSFHLSAETYINQVGRLAGFKQATEFRAAQTPLYTFLSKWRISPSSWGYAEPQSPAGYTSSPKWWLDAAGNVGATLATQPGFSALRIPISSNRASASNRIAGIDPANPESWCGYLKAVQTFWSGQPWYAGTLPYLYAQDEPGLDGMKLVARQAKALHACFPGAKALVTGNPSPTGANSFLWTAKDGSSLDVWAVLANRYYGKFTVPTATKDGVDNSRLNQRAIATVREAGAAVWTYNYWYANNPTPGYTATEPLSNPRMLELWAALEGIQGVLYGEGTTNYRAGTDPFVSIDRLGRFVLLYPAQDAPIPSARLLQIRDGVEDWAVYDIVRRKRGAAAVWRILGAAGLFSADAKGVRLGCTVGCAEKSATPFAWPVWSSDATTPGRIEAAKLAALEAASR